MNVLNYPPSKKMRVPLIAGIIVVVVGVLMFGRIQAISNRVVREISYRLPFPIPGRPLCPDCNIILISLDTLRADDLPCYGYSRNTMPNLCAYAKKNIQFSNFFSQSSYTLDSHMSIFTGLYPNTHHMIHPFIDELSPAIQTLTQSLKTKGYRTIYAGVTGDYALPFTRGLERGFDEIHDVDTWKSDAWPKGYEQFYSKLLDATPTFIFLHTYKPHAPYLLEEGETLMYVSDRKPHIPITQSEYYKESVDFYQFVIDQFEARVSESATRESKERNQQLSYSIRQAVEQNNLDAAKTILQSIGQDEYEGLRELWYWSDINADDPGTMYYLRGLYDQRIRALDTSMASLFTFLERPEVKRRTIVIITSDHGEEFMEHGSVLHNKNIFNTTTHVPFIMSVPRAISGIYNEIAQSIDIYPTLLSLIGATVQAPFEGIDISPVFSVKNYVFPKRVIISQHRGTWILSIYDGTWKLYVHDGYNMHKPLLLFNLKYDAGEQNNVASVYPDVVTELEGVLWETLKKSPQYPVLQSDFPVWFDQTQRENLIKDGYF